MFLHLPHIFRAIMMFVRDRKGNPLGFISSASLKPACVFGNLAFLCGKLNCKYFETSSCLFKHSSEAFSTFPSDIYNAECYFLMAL